MIEPALQKSEVKHIERLITIYMNQEPLAKFAASQSPNNDEVYTLQDCIQSNPVTPIEISNGNGHVRKSIWREAPGRSPHVKRFYFELFR